MDKIVPLISGSAAGPLGICHLPRIWLKILLHAKGLLPEGYRHGTGGADEQTLNDFGVDRDAFIAFVTTELPTYLECEAWFREHAKNLDPETIAKHNEITKRDKDEAMAAAQRAFVGIDAPTLRNSVMLNDLDDWTTVHAQVTKGALPPLVASSLNATFTEMLKVLLDETKASRATIRVDLPEIGLVPSKPAAEAKRPDVASLLKADGDAGGNALETLRRERKPQIGEAQMLGPVFRGEKLVAWIAVDQTTGPRPWADRDVKALERSAWRAGETLDVVIRNR